MERKKLITLLIKICVAIGVLNLILGYCIINKYIILAVILVTICYNIIYYLNKHVPLMLKEIILFNNSCNPYPLLESSYNQIRKIKFRRLRNIYMLKYVSALIAIGDIKTARKVIDSIDLNRCNKNVRKLYINNNLWILILENRFNEALELIQNVPKEYMLEMLEINKCFLDIHSGNINDTKNILNKILGRINNNMYIKVNIHYSLAEYYKSIRDKRNEVKHYEFVAKNGNKLYICNIAKEKLNKITITNAI